MSVHFSVFRRATCSYDFSGLWRLFMRRCFSCKATVLGALFCSSSSSSSSSSSWLHLVVFTTLYFWLGCGLLHDCTTSFGSILLLELFHVNQWFHLFRHGIPLSFGPRHQYGNVIQKQVKIDLRIRGPIHFARSKQ
jgi:hypothetical protein